jgi:SAM-dependent methyltransferase
MKNNLYYSGVGGKIYLDQRSGAVNEHNQSLRASLFRDLGGPKISILDFGCGTGAVVQRLDAALRCGVEVNEAAGAIAEAGGVKIYTSLEELPDRSIDVVISFHAIEHVDNPLLILRQIRRVLRPGGRTRLVVPCESAVLKAQRTWRPNSDRHLYTWTPLVFGNLAERAGFESIVCRIAPMPTNSRAVRALKIVPPAASFLHYVLAVRRNSLNVILEGQAT